MRLRVQHDLLRDGADDGEGEHVDEAEGAEERDRRAPLEATVGDAIRVVPDGAAVVDRAAPNAQPPHRGLNR